MDGTGKLQCIGNNPREQMLIKCNDVQTKERKKEVKEEYEDLLKKLCSKHFQISQEKVDKMLKKLSEEELGELRKMLRKKSAKFRRNTLYTLIFPAPLFLGFGFLPVSWGSVFFLIAGVIGFLEAVFFGTALTEYTVFDSPE